MTDFDRKGMGIRLAKLRIKKNLSQQQVADLIGVGRATYVTIEAGSRPLKDHEISKLASLLDTTTDFILRGTEPQNVNLQSVTGLSNEAINYLISLHNNRSISFPPMILDADSAGFIDSDGGDNTIALDTLNLILSTNAGDTLLNLIGQYCYSDFSNGYAIEGCNHDEPGKSKSFPCSEISFSTHGKESIVIPIELMKFSLLRGIEKVIDDLCLNTEPESTEPKKRVRRSKK